MKKLMKPASTNTTGSLALKPNEYVVTPDPMMSEIVLKNASHGPGGAVYAFVPVKLMDIDTSYQRIVYSHWKAIASGWDEYRCGTLIVSYRDGKFYVVDGQHRMLAARSKGVENLHCLIHTGLTPAQEAAIFSRQNDNCKRLSKHDQFRAGVSAGFPVAMAVKQACDAYRVGYRAGEEKYPGNLSAMDAAMRIMERHEASMLANVFKCIDSLGWHLERNAYSRVVLYALRNVLIKSTVDVETTIALLIGNLRGASLANTIARARDEFPDAATKTEALTSYLGRFARV